MKELSQEYIERFVHGELPKSDLRRAIDLTIHDDRFRREVLAALAVRDLVRHGYVAFATQPPTEKSK